MKPTNEILIEHNLNEDSLEKLYLIDKERLKKEYAIDNIGVNLFFANIFISIACLSVYIFLSLNKDDNLITSIAISLFSGCLIGFLISFLSSAIITVICWIILQIPFCKNLIKNIEKKVLYHSLQKTLKRYSIEQDKYETLKVSRDKYISLIRLRYKEETEDNYSKIIFDYHRWDIITKERANVYARILSYCENFSNIDSEYSQKLYSYGPCHHKSILGNRIDKVKSIQERIINKLNEYSLVQSDKIQPKGPSDDISTLRNIQTDTINQSSPNSTNKDEEVTEKKLEKEKSTKENKETENIEKKIVSKSGDSYINKNDSDAPILKNISINNSAESIANESSKEILPSKRIIKNLGEKLIKQQVQLNMIGELGELFVIHYEKNILSNAGLNDLAEKISHVSKVQGDGLGYDIISYDLNGDIKYIEVKTTTGNEHEPFYISENELQISHDIKNYYLYRVYNFDLNKCEGNIYVINGFDEIHQYFDFFPKNYKVVPKLKTGQ